MTRFTQSDLSSVLNAIEGPAKMQGLLPWTASLVFVPSPPAIFAAETQGGVIQQIEADFLPEFEEGDTITDMMRALTATLKVLHASKGQAGTTPVSTTNTFGEPSIYWDNEVEDDAIPTENLPFAEDTARIIDENEGGVIIAYCHVDTAARIVDALAK